GALLATNPLFAGTATQVRGYGLLCLAAVASTALLLRLQIDDTGLRSIGYIVVLALGVATHAYMVLVILGQAFFILGRGELSARWVVRWTSALLLGAAAYIAIVSMMLGAQRGSAFHAEFPEHL